MPALLILPLKELSESALRGTALKKIDSSLASDSEAYQFYRSIDPDTYLSILPPAKFVLIHSSNDPVISHDLALRTYSLAKEPKAMYNVTEATHGYTASMHPYLEKELSLLLN
ncbi:alpha/beta hydrolase [Methanosarcina barkeri]|uniref:alpha/beta hydrolase n=1 Tax=Methanosarcina barkeri TaxID=2208 RepID=UPI001FB4DE36|nr:alpha/beta hydrolase [Methanosarcina barkeri]